MIQKIKVDEIPGLVEQATNIRKGGEASFLEFLNRHSLDVTPPNCSPDLPEYRNFWESVHRQILGETYDVRRHENFEFDLPAAIDCPYPYVTREPLIISQQIRDWANILEAMNMPFGASILEMGAGWGNTSLLLAQSGFNVSVLDINHLYLDLINERSRRLGLKIETFEAEFLDIADIATRYDAILFYESFHHSIEHARLLRAIKGCLNIGGKICFAGEPIIEEAPYAWGLNPSGEALFQMHTHGWMELIFDQEYFQELLESNGLVVDWTNFLQGTRVAIASLPLEH